jgi:hypothetical protein
MIEPETRRKGGFRLLASMIDRTGTPWRRDTDQIVSPSTTRTRSGCVWVGACGCDGVATPAVGSGCARVEAAPCRGGDAAARDGAAIWFGGGGA